MTIPSPQFDTFRQCVRDETEKMQLGGYGFDRLAGVLSHTLRSNLPHSELLQVPTEEPVVLFLDHGRRRSVVTQAQQQISPAARGATPPYLNAFDRKRTYDFPDGLSSPGGSYRSASPPLYDRMSSSLPPLDDNDDPLAVVQRGFFSAREPSPPPQDYPRRSSLGPRASSVLIEEDGSTPFAVPSERRTSLYSSTSSAGGGPHCAPERSRRGSFARSHGDPSTPPPHITPPRAVYHEPPDSRPSMGQRRRSLGSAARRSSLDERLEELPPPSPPSHRRQPSRPLASPVLESPPSQADIASIAASINRRGSAAIVEELKSTMTTTLPRSSLAEFETDADGSQPGDRDADLSNEVTKESPFARTDRPIPAAVAGDRNERPIGAAAKANNAAFANVRKLPSPMPDMEEAVASYYNPREERVAAPVSGKRETATVGKDEKITPCPHCGRKFAESRLGKHITVCQKTSAKKERKVFDPSKQRLANKDDQN